jgi:hypothetical protein
VEDVVTGFAISTRPPDDRDASSAFEMPALVLFSMISQ